MQEVILTLNIGSSSVKFGVFKVSTDQNSIIELIDGKIEISAIEVLFTIKKTYEALPIKVKHLIVTPSVGIPIKDHQYTFALEKLVAWIKENLSNYKLQVIGHRVVHGANKFSSSVRLNKKIIVELKKLIPLAPLHQPYNVSGIEYLLAHFPDVLQIACFDTEFHKTIPDINRSYALPPLETEIPLKKWGFHGPSYKSIAKQLPLLIGDNAARGKVIVAHLGSGATLCAMENLTSKDTTGGFSTISGLPMSTRSGSIDHGIILYLLQNGMDVEQLTQVLYNESGLLGLSQISSDLRVLSESHDSRAKDAINYFVNCIVKEICSLMSILEGLDVLVFTAGIGEQASNIREMVCKKLQWIGVRLNDDSNRNNKHFERRISSKDSKIDVWVIRTKEDEMIADYALTYLKNEIEFLEAASKGDIKKIDELLKSYPYITHARAKETGNSAAFLAVANNQKSVLKYLIKNDPSIIHMFNNNQQSLLHAAIKHTGIKDKHLQQTPLFIAINISQRPKTVQALYVNNVQKIIKILLAYKADIHAKDCKGRAPLHIAAIHSFPEVVQLLVQQCGANVNVGDNKNNTPLHLVLTKYCAAQLNERQTNLLAIIKCLILLGGSIHATNVDGVSPLSIVESNINKFEEGFREQILHSEPFINAEVYANPLLM